MDKARAKKRQLKQQQKQQSACNGKLNSSNQDSDSQGEDEKSSTKKFKSLLDPAMVPRKLRSAIIKRGRDSLSPPSSHVKKPIHLMEACRNSKHNMKKEVRAVSGPITKDEEEVAEALFSLAKMSGEMHVKSKVENESLDDNKGSPHFVSRGPETENIEAKPSSSAGEPINPYSNFECSPKQNPYSGGLAIMGRPVGYGNNKFNLDIPSPSSLADLLRVSLPRANGNAIPLVDPTELGVSPEFCHMTGLVQQTPYEIPLHEKKLDRGLWPVLNSMEKGLQQNVLSRKGCDPLLALPGAPHVWPNKYRVQSYGGEVCGQSSWPSSIKLPPWMVSATSSSINESTETSVLKEKVKPGTVDLKQSLKHCTAHVYISRLIKAHQTSEENPCWNVSPAQLNLNENRIHLGGTSTNDLIGQRAGPNDVSSIDCNNALDGDMSVVPHGKSPSELRNANLQDQKIPLSSPGTCSSEKKSCEFLSLSAGCSVGGVEPVTSNISNSNQGGYGLMPSAQGQANCQLPAVRHHPLMPFYLSGARTVSPQSHMPPFYLPALSGQGVPTRQQLEQQQNQVWAAHLASQCRPGSNSGTHIPRWQNGGNDSPRLIPCAQPSFSSSPSSTLELFHAKGSQHQQQQLFAFSSLPSQSMGKREHHSFPRSYVEGSGLQADASPHLQLVCGTEHV